MEQVQIQCPNCKTVLLVKNTDGSRERVVNCPTCQTPLMVTFSGMGMVGGSQTGPMPQNPQGTQPMPQPSYGQEQPNPYYPAQENSTKKNNAWLIALLSALVLALAGVLIWLLVFKDKDKTNTTSTESSATKTEQLSSSASTSVSVAPEAGASVSSIPNIEDEIPEVSVVPVAEERASRSTSGYSLPYVADSETDVANQLIKRLNSHTFLDIYDGLTGADFKSLRSKDLSKGDNKQLTVEDANGYRYQFFFMNSNKYDGKLTGVAVSHKCYDARQECASFDEYLRRSNDFDLVGRNMYQSSWGKYISPGYAKGRLYVYYYLPDAPEKGAAPRK